MNDDDPLTVLRKRQATDPPRVWEYWLTTRRLARKWAEDAASAQPGDQAEDLGPEALPMLTQSAQRQRAAYSEGGMTFMVLIGTARGGKWITWLPPAPREPVPGSAGQAATRN
jgi:hypothetical protein